MTQKPLLKFDYADSLLEETGISQAQLDDLYPRLQTIRDELYAVDLPAFIVE